jgi:hypothetical protein
VGTRATGHLPQGRHHAKRPEVRGLAQGQEGPRGGSVERISVAPCAQNRWQRQEKSRAALGGEEVQRAPGLMIHRIVVSGRIRAHTPFGVSLYTRWPLSRVFGVGQSEGPEPSRPASSDPMREAGAPSTEEVPQVLRIGCARPTGDSNGCTVGIFAQDTTRQT